jgi:hypothetical protein
MVMKKIKLWRCFNFLGEFEEDGSRAAINQEEG